MHFWLVSLINPYTHNINITMKRRKTLAKGEHDPNPTIYTMMNYCDSDAAWM